MLTLRARCLRRLSGRGAKIGNQIRELQSLDNERGNTVSGSGPRGDDWRPEPKSPATPERKGKDGTDGGTGDGGGGEPDPCAIVEATNLNSVDRSVLATVRAGDVLQVVFLVGPPRRLIAQTSAGGVVGSITSPSMLQLIVCITQSGRQYQATVLSIRGALVQVEVKPA